MLHRIAVVAWYQSIFYLKDNCFEVYDCKTGEKETTVDVTALHGEFDKNRGGCL